ncbi:asparagine synthase (glutamine-hydrolyzing) [Algoriphagus sediminis]|uniref:asparagine synthase (glutamine-hydrolyzing) n=1 Tax=Algoriphagus sediminis TaxID=3057113 RepID=A0ABT7YC88_9BACT|nr:asparagine synthase (glutamine-hydrolyzing) [Algoriphagus sediminis]MDN3204138.1 asparagine synthase (glutamine-hydrolyzing) [Algoriphagus sediminis]
MCGIHLIWGQGAKEENLRILLESSFHRGPDHQDLCSPWPGLWIGVNRLRISDPTPKADQPFWTKDGHSLIIWNGEIYNHRELRSLLETMGKDFESNSDTEVLITWLRSFGVKGLSKLKGMFSLILVDVMTKSILVARDPSGEKPLYYQHSQDSLCISSSVSGINKIWPSDLDMASVENYAFLRSARRGHTFYKRIQEWKPNRFSQISNPGTFRFDPLPHEEESDTNSFEKILDRVVERQFDSDVPKGVLLSGGADSSLLYSHWYQKTGKALPAFTFAAEKKYQKKYDDIHWVRNLTDLFPAELHEVSIDQHSFAKHFEDYVANLDEPVGDSAGFLLWMLGKEAKNQGIKVLISGAGADELWGGYRRHDAFEKYLKNKRLYLFLKSTLSWMPLTRSYSKFFDSIHESEERTFLNFSALRPVPSYIFQDYYRIFDQGLDPYRKALDFDRRVYLVEDVLKVQDQALMAHGIEGRSPYLDSDFLSLWKQSPNRDLKAKRGIKELLLKYDLGQIANRKKLGFGLPLEEWFQEGESFAKKAFQSIKELENRLGETLPSPISEISQRPGYFVKSDFLMLYNLFLFSEWVNLRKK